MQESILNPEVLSLLVARLSGGCDPAYDAALIREFCDTFNLDVRDVWAKIKPLVCPYIHPSTDALN
jgi:hypothetical protein